MPLTPEDVSNKRFTPVRLREGYDMGEVDQFLDEVEAELERLLKESADLREKLAAAQGGAPAPVVTTARGRHLVDKAWDPRRKDDGHSPTTSRPRQGSAAAAAPRETIKVVTPAEASSAALRLLELATKNADEVVAEAKQEAEQIVGHGPHRGRAAPVRRPRRPPTPSSRRPAPAPRTSTPRPRPSGASSSATSRRRRRVSTARSRTCVPSSVSTAAA